MKVINKKYFYWIFICSVFLYAIFILIRRQISEDHLEKSHIYITVSVTKINFGKTRTVQYEFNYANSVYKQRKICSSKELRAMKVGDLYLAKFNKEIEFSELMCGCRLSKSDKGKVWEKFPGCKN